MSQPGGSVGRRGWMLVAGVVVLIGLLGAAAGLWFAAGERRSDNVASFARAPVGCNTTLDFEATGTFVLYIETRGEFDQLAGECDAEQTYDRNPEDVPELDAVLIDPEGAVIDFDDVKAVGYDVDGFVGTAVRSVEIETPGDHVLTVAPTDGEPFAVAIGRSPDEGVGLLRAGAIAAAIAGLVLGGVFLVLGSRSAPTPVAPPAAWTPDSQAWPASPPGFPMPPPTTGATGPVGPLSAAPPAAPGHPGAQRPPWGPPPPPPA